MTPTIGTFYEAFREMSRAVHAGTRVEEVLELAVWKITEILGAKGAILRLLNLDTLVVTQGNPAGDNEIFVFGVDEDGLPDAEPVFTPSAGIVPFGFIFDWRGHLLVSEAGAGAVSSYAQRRDKTLKVIRASVSNGNRATCWIAGTWHGTVFTSNTGSDNLSSYKVRAANGQLKLLQANAVPGNRPVDLATTADGRYLYVLNAADGSVGAFRILSNGNLLNLGTAAGLPLLFAQGIAVR